MGAGVLSVQRAWQVQIVTICWKKASRVLKITRPGLGRVLFAQQGLPWPLWGGGWLGATLLGGFLLLLPSGSQEIAALLWAGRGPASRPGLLFSKLFWPPAGAVAVATQEEVGGASWRPGGGSLAALAAVRWGPRLLRERGRFLRRGRLGLFTVSALLSDGGGVEAPGAHVSCLLGARRASGPEPNVPADPGPQAEPRACASSRRAHALGLLRPPETSLHHWGLCPEDALLLRGVCRRKRPGRVGLGMSWPLRRGAWSRKT